MAALAKLRAPVDAFFDKVTVNVDEHEVRHRACHLRPRSLRDCKPRLLECGHVVDAVADHRDVPPFLA